MSEAIYKSGQGYWTRMMSAAAFGLLAIMGSVWIWERWGAASGTSTNTKYITGGVALLFLGVMAALMFFYLGRNPRTVDFLIATEGEMKKVNWSTRREITGSTGVVIFTMLTIALFCFVCDQLFAFSFVWIGVLDRGVLAGSN
ncbi:MAG: preprotein translocase subunit SecE [Phycisphaerales bacterium]